MLITKFINFKYYIYFLLITFLNSFKLYYNIYYSLIGFYFINSVFIIKERAYYINIILFILSLYSSNIENIVKIIKLLLIKLNTSFINYLDPLVSNSTILFNLFIIKSKLVILYYLCSPSRYILSFTFLMSF